MPASDGPFGTAPDIGIGFSDAALLTFSFAGFGFLAYCTFVYLFVLAALDGISSVVCTNACLTCLKTIFLSVFCFIHSFHLTAIYTVVLLKLKNRVELGANEEELEEKKYEEQLTAADVSTLSRAQRRARARQIMKQQRRAAPGGVEPGQDAQPQAQRSLVHWFI